MMRRGPRLTITIALAGLVGGACAADGESASPTTGGSARVVTTTTMTPPTTPPTISLQPAVTAPVTSAAPASATEPPAPPTTPAPAPPPVVGEPKVTSTQVGTFEAPVGVSVRPGDAALYVIEQAGRIIRFDPELGTTVTVADIADAVSFDGEQGLLGLAFALDGTLAYLDYTDNDGDTTVVEYPVAADGTFDTTSGRMLIVIDQPYANHNGGDLAVASDGTLYIAMGDGGSGGDPERRASDPTTRLGALLRIDPAPSGDAPYSIPSDNPFAGGEFTGIPGAPEVWAWGLRNPWRFDIDPVNADLWIADVGQNRLEEVDVVSPTAEFPAGRGANFGWSAFEGTDRFNDDVADPGDLVFPVLTYEHGDDGCSISGGAVYRGTAIPGLAPAFVYGDYCSGRVWALDLAGARNLTLLDGFDQISAVDRGPDGELYVVERSGGLHRLVAAS